MAMQLPMPEDIVPFDFNLGEDMAGVDGMAPASHGVELPGTAEGYRDGADMTGLASSDPIPQGMDMGIESGMDMATDEFASSAEHTIVTSFEQMFHDGPHPANTQGIDSMSGLHGQPEPAPRGEQDTYSVGPTGDGEHER